MKSILSLIVAGVVGGVVASPNEAEAAPRGGVSVVWEVQIKYWYWDTTHSHWSTHLRTTNEPAARLTYQRLLRHKQAGRLNRVVPSINPRYMAVDVRLQRKLRFTPRTPLTIQPRLPVQRDFVLPSVRMRNKSKSKARVIAVPKRKLQSVPIRRNQKIRSRAFPFPR